VTDIVSLGVEVQTKGAAQSAQQLGQFQNAAKGAAGSADKLEDQLNGLASAQGKVTTAGGPIAGAIGRVGSAFKNNASSIQNASFQLSDIIVQMQGGTDASRVLGQQLPQLLGGFGALGAIAGVAIGALLSFAPAMFDTADAAEDLKEKMDALEDAMQRLNAAQKGQSLQDLAAQYGAQASAAQELLAIQRQIAEIEADRAFRAASGAVVVAMGAGLADLDFSTALDNAINLNKALADQAELRDQIAQVQAGTSTLNDEELTALDARKAANEELFSQLNEYRLALKQMAATFGVTEQAAANLVIMMTSVKTADTTESRVAATQLLAKAIGEATDELGLTSDQGIALYNALLDAALAGLDLKSLDLPSALSSAATEASRMADELGRAATNALSAASSAAAARQDAEIRRQDAEIRRQFVGDPIGQAGALAAAQFNRSSGALRGSQDGILRAQGAALQAQIITDAEATAALNAEIAKLSETAKGGAKTLNDIQQEAKRLYESTRTEAERFAAEQEKVETLYRAGAISGEVYTRALEDLNAKFDPFTKLVEGIADTVENELNNAFASVLDGTKSLGDALLDFASNVLAKVAQDLFAKQFAEPIAAGIKQFIGSADGNVFGPSGFVPFAKGGVVSGPTIFPFANGTGLMGEAGPEAIMPLSRGSDGKLGVVAANGNSAPTITINNYSGQEATSSTDSAGNIVVEIGRAIAQDITSGGPTYRAIRTTFGLGNRLQQRG
jgi:phage-related minor tail protein